MLVRSPRRFAILSFIAFALIFTVLQQSPWTQPKVYEQLPLFDLGSRPPDQSPIEDGIQAYSEDAWQHAVPFVTPAVTDGELVASRPGLSSHMVSVPNSQPTKSSPPWVTAPSLTASFVPPTPRPLSMKEYMKEMLKWSRPTWDGHWPPFKEYIDKAYDPNRWEQFDM